MAKECGHTVPCGCKDTGLLTPPPCGDGVDCEGTPCSETFDAECVFYTGEALVCGDDTLVEGNTSLADALAAVIGYFCDQLVLPNDLLCSVGDPTSPEIQVVSPAGASLPETLQNIVDYFCARLNGIDININNILNDITNIQGQLITSTNYSFGDSINVDGCTTRFHQLQLLAGVTVVSTISWSTPPICPPVDICGKDGGLANADTDQIVLCRYNAILDTSEPVNVPLAEFLNPPVPLLGLGCTITTEQVINSTAEESLLGVINGSFVFPALVQIGSVYKLEAWGKINNDTIGTNINIRIKSSGSEIASTGNISLQALTAKAWNLKAVITVRSFGAGTGVIAIGGQWEFDLTGSGQFETFSLNNIYSTFNNTITNGVDLTAQFDTASTLKNIACESAVLTKIK